MTYIARRFRFQGRHHDADAFRSRIFGPLLIVAALRHIRLHDLPHTYAGLLLAAGKELHCIQQQLGHHSPASTLAVYCPAIAAAK